MEIKLDKSYRIVLEADTEENIKELELRFYVMCKALGGSTKSNIKIIDNATGKEPEIQDKDNIDAMANIIQGIN